MAKLPWKIPELGKVCSYVNFCVNFIRFFNSYYECNNDVYICPESVNAGG